MITSEALIDQKMPTEMHKRPNQFRHVRKNSRYETQEDPDFCNEEDVLDTSRGTEIQLLKDGRGTTANPSKQNMVTIQKSSFSFKSTTLKSPHNLKEYLPTPVKTSKMTSPTMIDSVAKEITSDSKI